MTATEAGQPGRPPAPTPPALADVLDLEPVGDDVFRAQGRPGVWPGARLFGGQVAGQALMAAGGTIAEERPVHSAHGHFIASGDPALPVDYAVERVRDGRSFSTRRVVGRQGETTLFLLTASFHAPENGFRHQTVRSDAPDPETLPPVMEQMTAAGGAASAWFRTFSERFPLDLRFDGEPPRLAIGRGERRPPEQRFWVRTTAELGDDPALHAGAVTFVTDIFLLSSALPPHGRLVGEAGITAASLDHTVWYHRPFRADEWFCYEQEGFWADQGRALCRGLIFDRAGDLLATVMQEALIRPTRS